MILHNDDHIPVLDRRGLHWLHHDYLLVVGGQVTQVWCLQHRERECVCQEKTTERESEVGGTQREGERKSKWRDKTEITPSIQQQQHLLSGAVFTVSPPTSLTELNKLESSTRPKANKNFPG